MSRRKPCLGGSQGLALTLTAWELLYDGESWLVGGNWQKVTKLEKEIIISGFLLGFLNSLNLTVLVVLSILFMRTRRVIVKIVQP